MKLSFTYLSLALSLLILTISFAQPQEFLIQKYSIENGLPDNRVNDIVQDSLGRIWIAMKTGIAVYDGVEWKKFEEKDGVPEIEYIRIKIDEKGTIWFLPRQLRGQYIIYYKKSNWKKVELFSLNSGPPIILGSIDIKYNYDMPAICVGTMTKGLITYKDGNWNQYLRKDGLLSDITTKVLYKDDAIYVSSIKGLSVIAKNNEVKNFVLGEKGVDHKILSMIDYYSQTSKKKILYLLGENWIGKFVNNKIKLITSDIKIHPISLDEPITIKIHPSGDIFFSNPSKIFSYNLITNKINQIIFDNPSDNKGANSILIDYEGNIWFASTRGIYKCAYGCFKNYTMRDGLLENEVTAISEFNSGELVFGHNYGISIETNNGYMFIINGSAKTTFRNVRVLDFYKDIKQNIIYYCSYSNGVGKLFANGNVQWIKDPKIPRYFSIFSQDKKNMIVSTDRGLFKLDEDKLIHLNPNFNVMVRKGLYVNDTTIYLASVYGLVYWDSKAFHQFKNSNQEANNLFSLFYNKKYGLLVGSIKGLYTLKNDSLINFKFNEREINESVYFIIEDKKENIWIGTNNGVLKWDGENLKRYNKSDGLAGNETNRAAGFVDSKGNVWIGTNEGASMYSGKELDYSSIKPKLVLLGIEDQLNQKYNFASKISLTPNDNNLVFNFRGLSFIDESRNLYEVRLSEIDGDWNNQFVTNYTYSRFNNLLPGNYVFSARVKNAKGIWSDWKSSSVITINRHYYQQPLFILGGVLLALFILYYIYEFIQQKKYTKKLEVAVESRTKLLKDKQGELITSLERYRGIVDSQTDLVVRVDADNKFTFVNDAYCRVFGKKKEELIESSFSPMVHLDDRNSTNEEMKKLLFPPHRVKIEQRAVTINGYRWFSWENYAIFDEQGKLQEVQGVGRDVTLQKEIESELEKRVKERTTELKLLISQSPFGILTYDEKGFLIDFNNAANKLFRNLSEHILPNKSFNIYQDEFLLKNNYRERLLNLNSSEGLLKTNRILIDDSNSKIYKYLFSHYLIYRLYAIEYEDKSKNIILLLEDATDIQKTEEASKKLSEEKIRISTFIQTVEAERERISKELHDGIGQLLTTAKLKLDIFKLKTSIDKTEIDDALNILLNAGDEIRRIINDLRPSDIENFGLVSAIELLCDRIRKASGLNIEYLVNDFKDLSSIKRENLTYRIIQEALNNIIKHSNCRNAGVNIVGIENSLKIEIWDDGNGYDLENIEEIQSGFGISNMKERASLLGATINFSTSMEKGLKVILNIPIKDNV